LFCIQDSYLESNVRCSY